MRRTHVAPMGGLLAFLLLSTATYADQVAQVDGYIGAIKFSVTELLTLQEGMMRLQDPTASVPGEFGIMTVGSNIGVRRGATPDEIIAAVTSGCNN